MENKRDALILMEGFQPVIRRNPSRHNKELYLGETNKANLVQKASLKARS